MKQPCRNCPFRINVPRYIRREKAANIDRSLQNDGHFPCHETVDYSTVPPSTEESKICFGAALYLENAVQGGCRNNYNFRLAMMRGDFHPSDLRKDENIYDSSESFIEIDMI
jgi:hypothetical protein